MPFGKIMCCMFCVGEPSNINISYVQFIYPTSNPGKCCSSIDVVCTDIDLQLLTLTNCIFSHHHY